MPKLIIANWKLNPSSEVEAIRLAKESDMEGLVVCPPAQFVKAVSAILKSAKLGSQDVSDEKVEYSIIGHSDRRKLGETDEMVAEKMAATIKAGSIPILCVGETRAEREAGKTEEVVGRELKIGISLLVASGQSLSTIVIAYEPIWAIGTGTPDSPESMLNMVEFMKSELETCNLKLEARIIYGGSVTSKNAAEFLKYKEIAGALVGGASLDPQEIKKIVEISKKY